MELHQRLAAGGFEQFDIDISDAVLDDLRQRLVHTRFAPDFANDDWSYGTPTSYLREVVAYWARHYDWRAHEREMNTFDHHRATIDDIPVHVMTAPGTGSAPMPLVLLHGWPWTFWDLRRVVRPLADPESFGGQASDSFDVVVLSLPGYGWSSPLERRRWNFHRTATWSSRSCRTASTTTASPRRGATGAR